MCDQKIITQVNVQQLSYDKYTWRTCWSSVPTNIESAEFNRFLSPKSIFSSSLALIAGNCMLHACALPTNWELDSGMTCCRCNQTGRCKNCSCVKKGQPCQSCLTQRLGNCVNAVQTQLSPSPSADMPTQPTVSTTNRVPETPPTHHTVMQAPISRHHESPCSLNH